MQIAYLLTGGNQENRQACLQEALHSLAACGRVSAVSGLYETAAWGLEDQPSFLNQAIALQTAHPPLDLLHHILEIEKSMGRVRKEKYGPRVIDIDILFYDDQVIQLPGLTVPHPQLPYRRFALQCLHEIAPDLIHPVLGKSIQTLLSECTDSLTVYKLV